VLAVFRQYYGAVNQAYSGEVVVIEKQYILLVEKGREKFVEFREIYDSLLHTPPSEHDIVGSAHFVFRFLTCL
jgi:hypothetical protein